MNYVRSNTQRGLIVRNVSGAALTNTQRGYVAQLVDATGLAYCQLPTADGQLCQFVVEDVGQPTVREQWTWSLGSSASGATGTFAGGSSGVTLLPLHAEANVRCVLSGTCSGSSFLMAANGGKVKAATGANIWTVGTAEEDGVDGQYVLIRPLIIKGTF